jgi:hypothetical protein
VLLLALAVVVQEALDQAQQLTMVVQVVLV